MTIRINEEYLKDNYKEIQNFCFSNGVVIPLLINREADDEYVGYRFEDDEKSVFFERLDVVSMGKLEQGTIKRRSDMYGIINHTHPDYDSLNSYLEDELKEWCRENFQFKGVYNLI